MVPNDAAKAEEAQPLLKKDARKDEPSIPSNAGSGERGKGEPGKGTQESQKHGKGTQESQKHGKGAQESLKGTSAGQKLRERAQVVFGAPSQSTQSLSPEEKGLYPAAKMKVVRLDEIMDTNSLSTSKAFNVPVTEKHNVVKVTEFTPEKPVLDQQLFDKHYGFRRVDLTLGRKLHWHFKQVLKWRLLDWAHFWMGRAPITKWLPAYNWRQDLRSDIIGGVMLSIMCLPQGLAYGFLAGVPPVYGLITAIFGPIVYTIFGSSRHTSPGPFAIAALMVGGVVERFAADRSGHNNSTTRTTICCQTSGLAVPPDEAIEIASTVTLLVGLWQIFFGLLNAGLLAVWLSDHLVQGHNNSTTRTTICCQSSGLAVPPDEAIEIASTVTLLVGLWQIFFGLLNAGLLAVWLSDHLVQGLTSGAAVHVFTSQLKSMTGVEGVPPTSEAFGLIKFYICFFRRFHTIKIPCAVISVTCISLLLISNFFMDPVFRKWTNVKFPMEFVLVLFSTLIIFLSHGTRFEVNVPIVGKVDAGIPPPRLPSFNGAEELVWQAVTIAIISFVIHIALAKLISKRLNYEIDANQAGAKETEWFALGAMNAIASFFSCFAGGSSLGRTMMQVKFGTRSQMSTVICCSMMAVLAAIIVIAMKDLYIQLVRGLFLCRESIVDFMIFTVTFVAVILINVNMGLIIGIAFALLSVVFRTQWAESTCMGRIPGTSDFKGIKVFRFDAPLYFANAELFITSVYNACGINPVLVRSKLNEYKKPKANAPVSMEACKAASDMELRIVGRRLADATEGATTEEQTEHVITQLTHIIIDCSSIPYMDLMGKDALAQTYADYSSIDITVLMANCKVAIRQLFETTDFYNKVPKSRMFVSVNDAVTQALKEQRERYPEREVKFDVSEPPPREEPQPQPIALSPAQRTVVEEREEQATQSLESPTHSTQRGDTSIALKKVASAKAAKKTMTKTEKKKKDELIKKEEKKKDEKKKEEPPRKDEKKKEEPAKKEEKRKEEGKRIHWLRPFTKTSRKGDLEKTQ
ncbi:hypothetical protein Q1695_003488 [Nippostrongylus brasiliensis]|nr:hypothetical protein Q1695_003488 [Nippostrongylus brasiliensis]